MLQYKLGWVTLVDQDSTLCSQKNIGGTILSKDDAIQIGGSGADTLKIQKDYIYQIIEFAVFLGGEYFLDSHSNKSYIKIFDEIYFFVNDFNL